MDNNAKRWRFITINKNMLVTNFSMYFTFLLFFFSALESLNSIHHYASMQRFTESTQSLEIFKRSSRLWGERSAQQSAVGNIIWLSMHPRISVLTKSSIRMSALHVWWCKISHQLWTSPPRSPQSLREPSRKKPWEESNVLILTAMLWSINSFKNSVTVSRAQVSNSLRKEGNKEEKQNQHPLSVIH